MRKVPKFLKMLSGYLKEQGGCLEVCEFSLKFWYRARSVGIHQISGTRFIGFSYEQYRNESGSSPTYSISRFSGGAITILHAPFFTYTQLKITGLRKWLEESYPMYYVV
jgi:hypothetical protein